WNNVPPEAQAAFLEVFASLERRIAGLEKTIAELQATLNLNSTNSSKPPSTDLPAVELKRRPPAPPSGRKRGGQPGHKRHTRALVPPERLRETFEVKPTQCRGLAPHCRRTIPSRYDTRSLRSRPSAPPLSLTAGIQSW